MGASACNLFLASEKTINKHQVSTGWLGEAAKTTWGHSALKTYFVQ